MTTIVLDGKGILSGTIDFAEIEKREAEERALQQAAAERTADQEALQRQIEGAMLENLREEIQEGTPGSEEGAHRNERAGSHEFPPLQGVLRQAGPPPSPRFTADGGGFSHNRTR